MASQEQDEQCERLAGYIYDCDKPANFAHVTSPYREQWLAVGRAALNSESSDELEANWLAQMSLLNLYSSAHTKRLNPKQHYFKLAQQWKAEQKR